MEYFSLLYETEAREKQIKSNAAQQLLRNNNSNQERVFEFVGNKMVPVLKSNAAEQKYPSYFIDLNLDQTVKAILYDDDNCLNDLFYVLLPERTDILYRQDIFKDLDNEVIYNSILEFLSSISQINRLLESESHANHPLQRDKYHLDAIALYQTSIMNLITQISDIVKSTGLKSLLLLLKDHTATDTFLKQRSISTSLLQRIEGIYYTLTMQPGKVLINFERKENNYYDTLTSVFRRSEKSRYQISFFRQPILSHLELKLADILYAKEKLLFMECADFVRNASEFILPCIPQIEKELRFYVYCHDYMEAMKRNAFPITYPEITSDRCVEIKEFYDINLAQKAQKETDVIMNDFCLISGDAGAWITGANQGGKTTFARGIGQLVYFSLIGMPVPATYAKLPLFQGIFTHFTSEENSITDNGKLKEELLDIKNLLDHSQNKQCLYILNELFSSTTTADAYDMCILLINRILEQNATVLCVTHIPELMNSCEGLINLVTKLDNNPRHTRTYKIVPLAVNDTLCNDMQCQSYGIQSNEITSHTTTSHEMSSRTIISHAIISSTLPSHVISSHAIPSHAIPSHAIPSHAIPSHAIPSHAIPSHAIPSHAIPSHTISSHAISHANDIAEKYKLSFNDIRERLNYEY